jgi:chorismate mutase
MIPFPFAHATPSQEAALTAKILNYCHMSLYKIVSYNDRIVLEEEYSEIINNINLTKIQDEEIVDLLKSLMDAISKFKLNEGDKAIFMKEYEEQVRNALYESIGNLANPSVIMSVNPVIMAATMAVNIGSAYANYRNNMEVYKRVIDRQLWELNKSAILELNDVRKEFLSSYWKLMKKYDIPDKWRLTEKQMKFYLEAVKDKDPNRRLRQLKRLEGEFEAYPPFNYYLGQTAQELKLHETALKAYDKFESGQIGFFREDSLYSSTLMNKIQLLNPKSDRNEILRYLKTIIEQSQMDGRKNLFVGLWYIQFEKHEEAQERFQANIDNNFNVATNKMLLGDAYLKGQDKTSLKTLIDAMLKEDNVRNHQILYLLGKLPEVELVNRMKDQILGIYVSVNKRMFSKDDLILTLPDRWVIGDFNNFKASLVFKGQKYQSDKITTDRNYKLVSYHYTKIFNAKGIIKKGGKDELVFELTTPEFPVRLIGDLTVGPVLVKKGWIERVYEWVKGLIMWVPVKKAYEWIRGLESKNTAIALNEIKKEKGIYFKKRELRTAGGCYNIMGEEKIELCK